MLPWAVMTTIAGGFDLIVGLYEKISHPPANRLVVVDHSHTFFWMFSMGPQLLNIELDSKLNFKKLWLIFLAVFVVSLGHYLTPLERPWLHDVLRRLYYIPIFFGAVLAGIRGGLITAILCGLFYAPHILFQWQAQSAAHLGHHGGHLNKYIEITIFIAFGALFGAVMDRLREATETLKRSYQASQTSARLAALGQLSAGLAHEIRTPLTGIRSSLDIIEDECQDQDSDAIQEFLGLARREVDRADRLIGEFLSFAKPRPPHRQLMNCAELLDSLKPLIQPHAQKAGVALEILCQPTASELAADRDQMQQVLLNLALNAVQHAAPEEGQVLIESCFENNEWRVDVSNNGAAVEPAHRELIFDPFFTTRAEGVGLGLAISTQIVTQHQGQLELLPRGKLGGASFRLTLPRSAL